MFANRVQFLNPQLISTNKVFSIRKEFYDDKLLKFIIVNDLG